MDRERVLLWVSPMKGLMRFGKKGKLTTRYIRPIEILEKVGEVAYKLALPPILSEVYPVFHVSMLLKYHGDPSHVLDFSSVQLNKGLTYEEEPVAILARQIQKLRPKSYISVRVQCRGQLTDAATWESESDMRSRYPHPFTSPGSVIRWIKGTIIHSEEEFESLSCEQEFAIAISAAGKKLDFET
ncbi:uncharacterized protein [Nicotiana tomentosiformis]|uniref:uncharacterized protein n=1 Tax=Nicotiana tomentosiformis TaxID=4098 RepID=UPI00388CA0E3